MYRRDGVENRKESSQGRLKGKKTQRVDFGCKKSWKLTCKREYKFKQKGQRVIKGSGGGKEKEQENF